MAKNQIMYVPAGFRAALDRYAKEKGVRLSEVLRELTAFVELAASRATKEPALPPMVTAEEVAGEVAP